MMRKLLTALLTLALLTCAIPLTATAEVEPPTALDAPEHFGVSHYYGDSVYYTFSAPEDMWAYIEKRAGDDPDNKQSFTVHFQIDCKIDGGNWHHTPEWDSPKTVPGLIGTYYFTFVNGEKYESSDRWSMTDLFPEDEALKLFEETGWDYLKSHSITFRTRFAESFDYGETFILSPWSKEYTLSANVKADTDKLINHAPTLVAAEVKTSGGGEPYFDIKTGRVPGEVQDLHAMSGSSVRTEVWMRKAGDKEFKYIEYEWVNSEILNIEASDYFSVDGTAQSYAAEGYEIKVRYALDLRRYKQSGYADSSSSVDIYSPFSNVISHNMPAWSNASSWATGNLKKADDLGLIPDSLKGADLTRSITRKEFAAVSVKLYEKLSGKTATPAAVNPFKDTNDPEVLKAYHADIVYGTATDKYGPDIILNREQAATMLTRVFKKVFVQGWTLKDDGKFAFKYNMPPKFADDAKISAYAKPSVYFMVSHGIIAGMGGNNFRPRNTTTAEEANGYANATREQALLISVGMTEKLGDGAAASQIVPAVPQPAQQTPPVQPTPPAEPVQPAEPETTDNSVVGMWESYVSYGSVSNSRYIDYVFNSDGTFVNLIHNTTNLSCTVYKGNYTISGSTLKFTNRSRAEFDYKFDDNNYGTKYNKIVNLVKQSENAAFSPAEDAEYQCSLTSDSDGQLLTISSFEYRVVSAP